MCFCETNLNTEWICLPKDLKCFFWVCSNSRGGDTTPPSLSPSHSYIHKLMEALQCLSCSLSLSFSLLFFSFSPALCFSGYAFVHFLLFSFSLIFTPFLPFCERSRAKAKWVPPALLIFRFVFYEYFISAQERDSCNTYIYSFLFYSHILHTHTLIIQLISPKHHSYSFCFLYNERATQLSTRIENRFFFGTGFQWLDSLVCLPDDSSYRSFFCAMTSRVGFAGVIQTLPTYPRGRTAEKCGLTYRMTLLLFATLAKFQYHQRGGHTPNIQHLLVARNVISIWQPTYRH